MEGVDSLEIGTFVDWTESIPVPEGGAGATATDTSAARSADGDEAARYLQLRELLKERGTRLLRAPPGSSLTLDGIVVTFFAPARPLTLFAGPHPWGEGRAPPSGDELNGASLVAVVDAGEAEVLLPGDAEADILERYRLPPVDAVVTPHHGSRGAVSRRLLGTLQAGLAIVSVGKDNSFGHPDPGTIGLLAEEGDRALRTDESGWVSLLLSDHDIAVLTERPQAP
jgi:competence protein ComEC